MSGFAILFMTIGCVTFTPESGVYTIENSNYQNTCSEVWGTHAGLPHTSFNIDVDEDDNLVTIDEYWELELQDNVATLSEMNSEMTHSDDYTISLSKEWYFSWNEPHSATGYVGIFILCEGECPASDPSVPAEELPCQVSADYLIEKFE